jgi:uncharacterized OsmC-like protein
MAVINGIDMDVLEHEVIERSRKEPELFRKTFKAQTVWNNATSVTLKAANNEILVNCGCENPFVCGRDPNRAFNPLEVALGSLGTCMTVAYAAFAAVMGITVRDLRVEIEGDLDVGPLYHVEDRSPFGFSQLRMNVYIDSNATGEQLKELDELAQRKSPVMDLVTRPKPIETRIHSTAKG